MTDEQIVKALECCIESNIPEACNKCPLKRDNGNISECLEQKEKLSLDLIKRQKEEIEESKTKIERLKQIIDEQDKEIIKLQKRIIFWREDLNYQPEKIKSEAIWEFAERLKNKIWYNPACNRYRTITPDDIYDLARKMMEVQE